MNARAATYPTHRRGSPPAGSAAATLAVAALMASACGGERAGEAPRIDAAALGAALSELAAQPGDPELPAAEDGGASPESETARSGERLGEFKFTYYVIAHEPAPSLAATTAPDDSPAPSAQKVAIHDNQCEPIAEVAPAFARELRMQGSGVLRDGRVVSASRRCDCDAGGVCFFLPGDHHRWGVGAANRSLSPFRSVAVDPGVVSLGQTLYVPELDGVRMPGRPPWGGFVHDGCVVADDRGGSVDGRHLDFFAARRGYYRALLRAHGFTSVDVYDGSGRCDHLGEGDRPAS